MKSHSLSELMSNTTDIAAANDQILIETAAKVAKEAARSGTEGRSKRQTDSTIEVVALCMTQGLRAPGLRRVKSTSVRRVRRSVPGRRRRILDGSTDAGPAKKVIEQPHRSAPWVRRQVFREHIQSNEYYESRISGSSTHIRIALAITEMQKFYNVINYDYPVCLCISGRVFVPVRYRSVDWAGIRRQKQN